jgi:hypothetical protein
MLHVCCHRPEAPTTRRPCWTQCDARLGWQTERGRVAGIDVRFGSKADMCGALVHVRFTPKSDRESGLPANGHVRITPQSGRVGANRHVCFGPKADMAPLIAPANACMAKSCVAPPLPTARSLLAVERAGCRCIEPQP